MVATIERSVEDGVTLETMLPDLLREHPRARDVLDRYGLKGCGGRLGPVESIGFFARTHGVDQSQLLDELRSSIETPAAAEDVAPPAAAIEDTIYRRFFLGGIILILTAGATWGAWLLWQIGITGKFTGISIHHVNAHGHAQIFGWVGLFIMGFACQAFPRLWHTTLAYPRLAADAFVLMVIGLVLGTIGMTAGQAQGWSLTLALLGGQLECLAAGIFAAQMLLTFKRSGAKLEPYVGFVFAALFFFVAMSGMSLWHTYTTMTAATKEKLLWYVATYQAPLRDLQIHGLALLMVLGVSLRMLPPLFGVKTISNRRAWWGLGVLVASTLGETFVFIAYRWSGNHALAALLMLPWIGLAAGVWMVAAPWKLWRKLPVSDRSGKFVRAAYAWLAISLVMLLLLPVYQKISGIAFSHAYYGAIRHAITVGFISLMIMGIAAKVVPTLNGVDPRSLTALWGPFILVNVGCFLRVSLQTLTDWHPGFFWVVGVSGTLEVAGLAWWGTGLARIMRKGKKEEREEAKEEIVILRPTRVERGQVVAQVIEWWPGTLAVFVKHGFTLLANPVLRRTMARHVTIEDACRMHRVCADRLVEELNEVVRGSSQV